MWSVRKDGKQTGCTLVGQGEDGWDVVLSRNGVEFYGRRFVMRADAVAEAGRTSQTATANACSAACR